MLDSPRPTSKPQTSYGPSVSSIASALGKLMSCTPPSLNRCRSYALSSRTWNVFLHPARRKACSSRFEPCWRTKARSKLVCALPEPLPLPMLLPHPISLASLKPWSPRPMIASLGSRPVDGNHQGSGCKVVACHGSSSHPWWRRRSWWQWHAPCSFQEQMEAPQS